MRYADFDLYKDLIHEKTGLYIGAEQSWVLESRLAPVAAKWGYPSIPALTIALRGIPDPGLIKDVIEAIVSHDTQFFRHPEHFEQLRDYILPHMAMARSDSGLLRIWSAGCGTGQEAYSLALFLRDHADLLGGLKVEIIATDICSSALDQARTGLYTQDDIQRGLSIHQVLACFDQIGGGMWQIKPPVSAMVRFQYGNLLENFERLGTFDIIFCCNVMQDIAHDRRDKVLKLISQRLAEDGVLFTEPREPLAT